MSNEFEIKSFAELYEIANKLCNTIDGAMVKASTGISGNACHGDFERIGELQTAFNKISSSRSHLRKVAELDKSSIKYFDKV